MTMVCIIGAGMAGSVLACELLRHNNCKVTLIDTDSIEQPFSRAHTLDVAFRGDSFIEKFQTVGYGFGGTSNLWHGVLTRLDDEDYEYLEPAIRERMIEDLRATEFHLQRYFGYLGSLDVPPPPVYKHPLNRYVDLAGFERKRYVVKVFPTRFRKLLRGMVRSRDSKLSLIQESVATHLHCKDKHITAVECSRGGSRLLVQADKYVICAGALETPRLIMQSLEGSSVYNKLLGCGLMDHPVAILGEISLPRKILYGHHGRSSILIPNSQRIGFRIPVQRRRTQTLNHSLFFRPHFDKNSQTARDNIRSLVYGEWRTARWDSLLSGSMFKSAMTLGLEKTGMGYFTNRFLVSAQFEQLMDASGGITLGSELDIYQRRIPLVQNSISEELLAEAKYLSALVAKYTHPQSLYMPFNLVPADFTPGSHHSGTCRLGTDPGTSVVDLNLRYHGLENLYVCDGSVLPKIGNANLSLTIAGLAVRLARILANK